MSDTVVEALLLDLLEWVSSGEKTYAQVMDACARRARECPSGKRRRIEGWSRENV